MFILDTLFVGGLRFVLDKIATAVDTELNDETALREQLLAGQMRLELGEIDAGEFAGIERAVLARLREIRERTQSGGTSAFETGEYRVTGADATLHGDEHA